MPDDRLSIDVEHADGRHTRWSASEVDGKNIPNDLTFGTSIPGGYGQGTCSLLRRLDQDHPDQDLFDTVTIHGAGGRIAHQGFAQQFPRSHGDSYAITPGWVGGSASMRWDPSFREVYGDRDPGSWGSPSLAERIRAAGVSEDTARVPVSSDDGGLTFTLPGESLPVGVGGQLWYAAPAGVTVGKIGYRGAETNISANVETPRFIFCAQDSISGTFAATTITLDDTQRIATPGTARQYVCFNLYVQTLHTPTTGALRRLSKVAVYGNHGLTTRAISGDPDGFYASDVIADIISRAAPLLTYTTGADGSTEPTTFAIPHLVYRDPVTAEFAVSDVNKYHLYDWGVYDDLEFFYRQPDPDRLCWEARLGDGAHMDADGLTGEQVINGVFVTYTDPTGVQKTVGPPGGSFDATDSALQDTSESNPANSHDIPAKWDQLTLSFPTTQAGATQIGTVYLAERSLATRRGSLRLTGLVQHPTEGKVPVWRVRAGDWIRVTDLNGENASVQRKIISTSYSHQARQITCELDNTPAKLSGILERVGILAGIATGGGF